MLLVGPQPHIKTSPTLGFAPTIQPFPSAERNVTMELEQRPATVNLEPRIVDRQNPTIRNLVVIELVPLTLSHNVPHQNIIIQKVGQSVKWEIKRGELMSWLLNLNQQTIPQPTNEPEMADIKTAPHASFHQNGSSRISRSGALASNTKEHTSTVEWKDTLIRARKSPRLP